MKDYIQDWTNGEQSDTTHQVSARVNNRIFNNIDTICAEFGIKKTSVIEAALDYGTRYLLEEIHKMNKEKVEMVGRMAKKQGKEDEFNAMIKGAKDA